jgi:tetratricopeptide (TPR) repeat protein
MAMSIYGEPRWRRPPNEHQWLEDTRARTSTFAIRTVPSVSLVRLLLNGGTFVAMNEAMSAEISRLFELAWRDPSKFEVALRDAERLLREYLETNPTSVAALTSLGAVLSDAGRHHDAILELRRAEALGSSDANTYYNLAAALMNTADRGLARRYFKKAASLQASPHTLQAYFDPHGY